MPTLNLNKAPFPWFGGKAGAADSVWAALGDVDHYVEPFGGSLAVLFKRPHPANRPYNSESVGDADALLVNFWRAVQADPEAVAHAASWPVTEYDKHARACALLKWRDEEQPAHIAGDPLFYDARMAGWWAWCVSVQIGGFGVGGPWWPDETGRLRKRARHSRAQGDGVGVPANLPNVGHEGAGVVKSGLRSQGVGVLDRTIEWEAEFPEEEFPAIEFHSVTMPALVTWLQFLSARLRHVRLVAGDWSRLATDGVLKTLSVRSGGGIAGVFLDPPYSAEHRRSDNLYASESATVSDDVRAWCLRKGDDPQVRIVVAGYHPEHVELEDHGWRAIEWFKEGFLSGGMANIGSIGSDSHRERLWLSPHCLMPVESEQQSLFDL